ncbi:MAG TPA: hypothetical protein VFW24_07185 [Acidimicrobiales bacterium]|nr:hypothetical protein [Acidimicrobiales bacterium]
MAPVELLAEDGWVGAVAAELPDGADPLVPDDPVDPTVPVDAVP